MRIATSNVQEMCSRSAVVMASTTTKPIYQYLEISQDGTAIALTQLVPIATRAVLGILISVATLMPPVARLLPWECLAMVPSWAVYKLVRATRMQHCSTPTNATVETA